MKGNAFIAQVVEPYAQALMAVAQSQNLVDKFEEDIQILLGLLDNSADLTQLIGSPLIKPEQKKVVLQQLLAQQIHPLMTNFLMLLVDRRRIQLIQGIGNYYQTLLRKLRQTVLAEVTSAVTLTEQQCQEVARKVTAITGSLHVELDTNVDPDLIGGVIIKVGSQVLDASIRGQLRRISLGLGS
ncbi:MAG: F0F1 ATP synthase subunit delta [Cyanobacteria bacterium WB6_1B_304]|jgi:F-type H+-transporting ATPase subunit delta|nr:F0F1 ATP synthase subunit delta [Cyanobacteria bacterium WB6_1B_304]